LNFSKLCQRSLVPNLTKSKNFLKITIFTKCLFFNVSTALLHKDINITESLWHYFKTNIIMHLEQDCALCEIWEFHSRNMLILTKFLDFVMFGTRELWHNGEKFEKFYHLHLFLSNIAESHYLHSNLSSSCRSRIQRL
jgi:hypothetical protein